MTQTPGLQTITWEVGNWDLASVSVIKGRGTLPIGDSWHKTIIIPEVQNAHSLRTTLEQKDSCSNPWGRKRNWTRISLMEHKSC